MDKIPQYQASPQHPSQSLPRPTFRAEKGTIEVDADEVQKQISTILYTSLSLLHSASPPGTNNNDNVTGPNDSTSALQVAHAYLLQQANLLVSQTPHDPPRLREQGEREAEALMLRHARERTLGEIEEKARGVLELVAGMIKKEEAEFEVEEEGNGLKNATCSTYEGGQSSKFDLAACRPPTSSPFRFSFPVDPSFGNSHKNTASGNKISNDGRSGTPTHGTATACRNTRSGASSKRKLQEDELVKATGEMYQAAKKMRDNRRASS